MKNKIIIIAILLLLNSCCTKEEIVPTLIVTYKNISSETKLLIYKQSLGSNAALYTEHSLTEKNNYSYHVVLLNDDSDPKYFLVLGDSSRVDTISSMFYSLTGICNHKIADFKYKHNGISKTEKKIIIK